jgi:RNA polymerase sigma-70 factor, ECF subfamily
MRDDIETTTLPELDDEMLLRLISTHDESALGHLYERYARLLYSIALRITNDRAASEEVLQDTFQAVWQRATTFRPHAGSVSSWLSGIARNRAIDEVRSRWHRARERETPLDYLPDLHGAVERGLEQFAVLRTDLVHALGNLPALQRQAIELAYFGGLSSSEIAAHLNEPIGTIKGRLRLGMDKLREALRSFMDGDES